MAEFEPPLQTVNVDGTIFRFTRTTGLLLDTTTRSDTTVSGGGANNGPVVISSTTKITSKLFLLDETGKEHAITLENLDLPARPGNVVSIVRMVRPDNLGWQVLGYNHSTGTLKLKETAFAFAFGKSRWHTRTLIALYVIAVLLGLWMGSDDRKDPVEAMVTLAGVFVFVAFLLSGFVPKLVGHMIAGSRTSAFLNGPGFAALRQALETIDVNRYQQMSRS